MLRTNRILFLAAVMAALVPAPRSLAGVLDPSNLVSQSLDPAPGVPAARFDDDTSTFEQVRIDGSCRLYYSVELDNGFGPAVAGADLGLYSATNSSNVTLQATDVQTMPTLPERLVPGVPGAIFGQNSTTGGFLNGIPTLTYFTTGGTNFLFGASFKDDGSGTSGVMSSVNNSALFAGDSSSGYMLTALRRGNPAPGTVGAIFGGEDFRTTGTQRLSYNAAGNVALLTTSLSGGDVVPNVNNKAIYGGSPFSPVLVARRGDPIGGAGHTLADISFNAKINASSHVLFDGKLSGGDVTGTTNDDAFFINTGSGNMFLHREGSVAPGTGGATFSGAPGLSSNSFTTAGLLFASSLSGTPGGTADDQALFVANTAGVETKLAQEGDAASGLGAGELFGVFNNTSVSLTNSGRAFFHNSLTGPSVTTSNDSSYWTIPSGGTAALIAREGDAAPGTAGAIFGAVPTGNRPVNGLDQVILQLALAGGDVTGTGNDSALYLWDAASGLTMLSREGDMIMTPMGMREVSNWSVDVSDNGNGSAMSFNDSGYAAIEVSFTTASGGGQAIYRVLVPEPVTGSLLAVALGALGLLRRR
jgi:hypothetical protein